MNTKNWTDPIVEEVHEIRQQMWEECNQDPKVLYQHLKEAENQYFDRMSDLRPQTLELLKHSSA